MYVNGRQQAGPWCYHPGATTLDSSKHYSMIPAHSVHHAKHRAIAAEIRGYICSSSTALAISCPSHLAPHCPPLAAACVSVSCSACHCWPTNQQSIHCCWTQALSQTCTAHHTTARHSTSQHHNTSHGTVWAGKQHRNIRTKLVSAAYLSTGRACKHCSAQAARPHSSH
jgi:hypothetical protein